MRLKDGFVLREVCGETVIIGEGGQAVDFGRLLVLNDTAAWLWREACRMGEFTIDSLTDSLCKEYDVPADVARADVGAMVEELKTLGVAE